MRKIPNSSQTMQSTPLFTLLVALALAPTLCGQSATQVWATLYNGPANNSDLAFDVAVDNAGNVAVTGKSQNLNGNFDCYTAKYAATTGALLWEKRYNGPADRDDTGNRVALDSAGNVFITGSSFNASGTADYYTAKYAAADGTLLWERRYDAPTNGNDEPYGLAVDAPGNVAVTGRSNSASGAGDFLDDIYTAKYAGTDGALLWEKRYNGPINWDDRGHHVAVDSGGNVIITGFSRYDHGNVAPDPDFYTAKYAAADGALLWEKRYNGPANDTDAAYNVAVDTAGNVAVTGASWNGSNQDYCTVKYAGADGALLWEKRYNGPGNGDDLAYRIAMDGVGNVVVTGYSAGIGTKTDYYTAKYAAADGAILWEKRYNGPDNGDDLANDMAMDGTGNVVVTGQSFIGGSNSDFYTVKYAAADGAVLLEARYHGPAGGTNGASSVAITADGGAVVTGWSSGISSTYDYATIRYALPAGDTDGDGLQDWWERFWWGVTAGHSALDDFDHDGIPELLEEGFGLNPKQPDALPPVVNEGGYLTITITKHPGVTYEVQTAATPDAPAFSPATTTVLVNDATTLKVRDNFLIGTPPARYLRVKVTAAP